jgi:hypothetical protein
MTTAQQNKQPCDMIPGAGAQGRTSGMTANSPVSDAGAAEPVILERLNRDGQVISSTPMLLAPTFEQNGAA